MLESEKTQAGRIAQSMGEAKPDIILQLPMNILTVAGILQVCPDSASMTQQDDKGRVRIYFKPEDVPAHARIVASGADFASGEGEHVGY